MTLPKPPSDIEIAQEKFEQEQEEERQRDLDIHRASEVEDILRNPLITEAFDRLDGWYNDALRYSPIDKPEIRERARYRLDALEHFKNELQRVMVTGTIASKERSEKDALVQWLAQDRAENG
jgi:hypothetical protein